MRLLVLGPDEGWHANQLRDACNREGHDIAFGTYESLRSCTNNESQLVCESHAGPLLDFDRVLTRTMPMGSLEQITFRLSILHALEDSGFKIVNPARSLELAIDKYATTARMSQLGLNVPRTAVAQTRVDAMEAFAALGGSVVVKPVFGGEGRGVMQIESEELAWTTFTTLEQLGAVIYQQEFVPPGGRDLRLLVIGKSVWAVERTNPNDWRTNVSRGGTTCLIKTSSEHSETALRICKSFNLSICGIDVIFDQHDKPYVLEVNGVPGWKGAQSVIGDNLADHIVRTLAGT